MTIIAFESKMSLECGVAMSEDSQENHTRPLKMYFNRGDNKDIGIMKGQCTQPDLQNSDLLI